jgi:AraC-like DNA-binding protein
VVPVTQIALDVGFEDLSNFIRSFRAEFGVAAALPCGSVSRGAARNP